MFRHVFTASVILMSVTSLGLAQNATLYFAQFGNGSLGAISLKSEIVLANPSPTEIARGTVTFFQADGSLFATGVVGEGSTSSVSFVVPPLGSTTISTTGQGELGAGTAVVTFDGDLGAVIRFEIRGPAGVGSGIAGVPSSQIQSGFVAPARRVLNGINTGVAVRNVGEGEVTLNLSLRGEDGAEIPNGSVSRIVGGSGQLVEFIDTLFPSADTSAFVGNLVVSTDGLVAGTAIEQGVNPGELTTLPVIPLLERASITDANLEKCIKGALGISEEAPLTIPSAQTLTVLECDGSDFQPERIVSLEGLEVLRNLRTLVLRDNVFISDISPLSGLAQLTSLDLERNAINDISSLAGLVGLTFLNLSDNMITDIAGLEDLAQLRELRLSENTVSDITSLAELAQLENLRLEDNSITNIDALSGLTRLAGLHLSGNMIGDFTPLQGLAQLINLGLNQTSIDDLSVVSGLSQLQSLFLTGNGISDVNPVAGLTQLENLALDNNSVSNLQPFVNNVDFAPDFIGLFGNPLDVDDCADLQTLMSRGTNISHDVPCAP